MRAHVKPAPKVSRPSHHARLGTERGTLPDAPSALTLADLPDLPDLPSPVRAATVMPGPAMATPAPAAGPGTVAGTADARRAGAFMGEHDLTVDELLTAVLDGDVTVVMVAGSARVCNAPATDSTALSKVRLVRAPAPEPLRGADVLDRVGCTPDELLADVLSGALTVYRAVGGPRFAAVDCPATAVAAAPGQLAAA